MAPELDMTDPTLDLILQLAVDRQGETLPHPDPQPPSSTLIDARFLEHTDLDADGAVISYTVQAAERFRAPDGQLGGRILDIGHYANAHAAHETYETLQESLREGEITLHEVGALGAALATENGLDPQGWRTLEAEDTLRFTNAQARDALYTLGLEVTDTFDLHRDTVPNAATGERALCSVFQREEGDPTQGCQPLLITLNEPDPGAGFVAQAAAFGLVGDLETAEAARETVDLLLESGGLDEALHFAETLTPPTSDLPAWSPDIA